MINFYIGGLKINALIIRQKRKLYFLALAWECSYYTKRHTYWKKASREPDCAAAQTEKSHIITTFFKIQERNVELIDDLPECTPPFVLLERGHGDPDLVAAQKEQPSPHTPRSDSPEPFLDLLFHRTELTLFVAHLQ